MIFMLSTIDENWDQVMKQEECPSKIRSVSGRIRRLIDLPLSLSYDLRATRYLQLDDSKLALNQSFLSELAIHIKN